MVVDGESSDDLGLPLVRGPFATLDEARAAIDAARSGPAPTSNLGERIAALPRAPRGSERASRAGGAKPTAEVRAPRPPKIELRDVEPADGAALRALWADAGLEARDGDDRSLGVFAQRNPGLLVVATAGDEIVASALGAWDGRRGRIYDVATAPAQRRKGLATRLVRRVEGRLRAMGCPTADVTLPAGNDDARQFWAAIGYAPRRARDLGKEL